MKQLIKIIASIPYAIIMGYLYTLVGFEGIVITLLCMIHLDLLVGGEDNE